MDCPVCGFKCKERIIGQDSFGEIKEYACPNCSWTESDRSEGEKANPPHTSKEKKKE